MNYNDLNVPEKACVKKVIKRVTDFTKATPSQLQMTLTSFWTDFTQTEIELINTANVIDCLTKLQNSMTLELPPLDNELVIIDRVFQLNPNDSRSVYSVHNAVMSMHPTLSENLTPDLAAHICNLTFSHTAKEAKTALKVSIIDGGFNVEIKGKF